MAKIVYFESPIDESKCREIVLRGTLGYALKQFGIEKDPLCVTINGMTPDELSLDTVLDDTDVVEVRRLVHGGGDADTKRTLATVVQIAALVAVSTVDYSGTTQALILTGSAVAAGALNKWANDIMAANAPNIDDQDVSIQTNQYSLKGAVNKARPLSPLPLPIGSHRMAPDVHADVYRTRYGWVGTGTAVEPYLSSFIAGIVSSNGPMAANNSWAIMPANFISPGFPVYPIKIAPFGIINKTTALTPSENADVIGEVAASLAVNPDPARVNFNWYRTGNISSSFPVIIYHHDPSDPYVGRFNCMFSLQRLRQWFPAATPSQLTLLLADIFNGTQTTLTYTTNYWNEPAYGIDALLTKAVPGIPFTNSIPSTLNTVTNVADMSTKWANFLRALNGGTYTSTPKTTSPGTQMYIYDTAISQVIEGVPMATQLFNFGLGDVNISERMVGSVDASVPLGDTVGYQTINKTGVANPWWVPTVFPPPSIGQPVEFFNEVINFPPKSIINPGILNGLVSNTDQGKYNFNYFSARPKFDLFEFTVRGRIYSTSGGGFASNTTRIQMQWRFSDESEWRNFTSPIITITNANSQTINLTYTLFPFVLMPFDPNKFYNAFLEVRIRKVNLDSSDNAGNFVSDLSIVDACFRRSFNSTFEAADNIKSAPMNIEGLYTTALIADSATTNQFSALVESKCWVYDFDALTWSWTTNRNPAFWFLFYARGGFLNVDYPGDEPYPYGPTKGWVNYPGHPDSTLHIFGGGYKDTEIDIDKILEWAFFCEEQELYIDMIIKDDTSVSDILERIANVGRGSVTYYSGKLGVVYEDQDQVPVCMFGMGNIIAGSFSVDYAVGDPVREVVGKFTNRDDWEEDSVSAIVPFSDADVVKQIEIVLDGVTDRDNAQREVNILAARQFYQRRTYTWQTDIEGYLARRGDLVYLSHDSTQYGSSGRCIEFVMDGGDVVGIKTGSFVDSTVQYVSIRSPDGEINTYTCEFANGMIKFTEAYPLELAPFQINKDLENPDSDFPGSIPEDFVFIADIKSTTGKRVRISQVEVDKNQVFTITAVDEDPSMWAFEYNDIEPATSFNDSEVVAEVFNLREQDLGEGQIKLFWEVTGAESVQVINLKTGLPLEANGQYSFSDGSIIVELPVGIQTELEVRPLAFGTPFRSVSKKVKVWPV